MAWNDGTDASGGGYSSLFLRPAYQDGLTRGATRGVPDVAANADPATAMAMEYSDGELRPATGTSASDPAVGGRDRPGRPASRTGTWASSTPPSTPSPAAPPTTAPSTT